MLKEKKKFSFKNISADTKYTVMRTAVAILIGLALAVVLIYLTAEDKAYALKLFFTAPVSSARYFAFWMQAVIPIMISGAAVCIMFSANQFNLGLEGSIMLGALTAAVTNIYLFPKQPFAGTVVGCLLAMVIGMIVTAIPAILNKVWNASVMVSSLMMNYICLYLSDYLLFTKFKNPKATKNTYDWADDKILAKTIKIGKTSFTFHISLLIALAVCLVAWFILYRTKLGFKIRETGQNFKFAKYIGVSVAGVAIASQLIGGAVGGLCGAAEILTNYTNYNWVELSGFGWDGVTMAIFAKNNPKNLPIAALFIGYLRAGAKIMALKAGVESQVTSIIVGVIILFVLAERFLSSIHRRMIVKEAEAKRTAALEASKEEK